MPNDGLGVDRSDLHFTYDTMSGNLTVRAALQRYQWPYRDGQDGEEVVVVAVTLERSHFGRRIKSGTSKKYHA
jgi:hypothetical protein